MRVSAALIPLPGRAMPRLPGPIRRSRLSRAVSMMRRSRAFPLALTMTAVRTPLLAAGVAGGFGAVFGTPIAGTVFGLEVVVLGSIEYAGWLAALGPLIAIAHVARGGRLLDPGDDPQVQGVVRALAALQGDDRVQVSITQTVGEKGWDGFALVRRVS